MGTILLLLSIFWWQGCFGITTKNNITAKDRDSDDANDSEIIFFEDKDSEQLELNETQLLRIECMEQENIQKNLTKKIL